VQSYRGEKVIDEPYEPYDDDDDQSVETGSSTTPTPVNWVNLCISYCYAVAVNIMFCAAFCRA